MKKWVFALIIGIALLGLGARSDVGSSTVTCGSETMYPGDVCEETRGGVTTDTKTYAEMKESQEAGARTFNSWGRWVLLGVGGVLAIVGIAGIVVVRRRRAAAPAQPQTAQPQTAQPQTAQPQTAQPQTAQPRFAPQTAQPQTVRPQFAPPQQMPNAPYPPAPQNAPYPQRMPAQQPYPPQSWGPSGPQS